MPDTQEQNPATKSSRKPLRMKAIAQEPLVVEEPASQKEGEEDAPVSPGKRQEGKGALILKLLKRKSGATITELSEAAGWQAHSVRGYLSAVVRKRMALKLERQPRKDGQNSYRIAS